MKAYWGVELQLHSFFDLGTRWRWVVSFTPLPLYLQEEGPWYPLDRRVGGLQSHSGRCGEEKNSQPPSEIEPLNPNRSAHSPELYRLTMEIVTNIWTEIYASVIRVEVKM
jgi:hypothetical protein